MAVDRITEQPEYYPAAAETDLLHEHAAAIATELGASVDLVELGSGSSLKTRILLDALHAAARYVPVDISAEHLHASAATLRAEYPTLRVEPLVADYARPIRDLRDVEPPHAASRRVVFFPGSSVGNFEPDEARAFVERAAALAGRGGVILIGIDLPKDRATLERAYDDAAGVTAAFNLNLLHRLRRDLGADVEPGDFRHEAVWQAAPSRIEMRLVATRATSITLDERRFPFRAGEHVVTEHCYKYDVERWRRLALDAGTRPREVYFDRGRRVSLHWLDVP